jgi:hypothetical protein
MLGPSKPFRPSLAISIDLPFLLLKKVKKSLAPSLLKLSILLLDISIDSPMLPKVTIKLSTPSPLKQSIFLNSIDIDFF